MQTIHCKYMYMSVCRRKELKHDLEKAKVSARKAVRRVSKHSHVR
jgi:hypothetical protein